LLIFNNSIITVLKLGLVKVCKGTNLLLYFTGETSRSENKQWDWW